jgi:hypothetical protein
MIRLPWLWMTISSALKSSFPKTRSWLSGSRLAVFVLGPDGCPNLVVGRRYDDLRDVIEAARDEELRYWLVRI